MEEVLAAGCVSIRELGRNAGALVHEIDRDGKSFAVSRHGRIVAMLVPIPERIVLEFDDIVRAPKPQAEPPDVELSAVEEEFLVEAAAVPAGGWRGTFRRHEEVRIG